jgi:hypothetical protein
MIKTLGIRDKGFSNVLGALSLMPSTSVREQLGDITSELGGKMVGPQEAGQAREAYRQQLLQPYQAQGTRPRSIAGLNDQAQTPPSLQDKIVFRDPIQDQLKLYQAHYGTLMAGREAIERDREEASQKRQDASLAQQDKIKTRSIELGLIGKGASPQIANEIAEYQMGLRDLEDLSDDAKNFRSTQARKDQAQIEEIGALTKKAQVQTQKIQTGKAQAPSSQMFQVVSPDGTTSSPMKLKEIRLYKGKPVGYPAGSQIRPVQKGQPQQQAPPNIETGNASLFQPFFGGVQGGPPLNRAPQGQMNFNLNQPQQPQRPLNPKQRETFNDIKRNRPDLTDEQVRTYMQKTGKM